MQAWPGVEKRATLIQLVDKWRASKVCLAGSAACPTSACVPVCRLLCTLACCFAACSSLPTLPRRLLSCLLHSNRIPPSAPLLWGAGCCSVECSQGAEQGRVRPLPTPLRPAIQHSTSISLPYPTSLAQDAAVSKAAKALSKDECEAALQAAVLAGILRVDFGITACDDFSLGLWARRGAGTWGQHALPALLPSR